MNPIIEKAKAVFIAKWIDTPCRGKEIGVEVEYLGAILDTFARSLLEEARREVKISVPANGSSSWEIGYSEALSAVEARWELFLNK